MTHVTSENCSILADRTNSRAIGTVLSPSVVVCLYGMYCG